MSDLAWVAAGFGLVYGAIAAYTAILEARRRRAGRRAGQVRP
jgi:type IV secretory pathway TrbD component